MKISLSHRILVEDLSAELCSEIIKELTLFNPKWIENNRMGRWNRGTPKVLRFFSKGVGGRLYLPRGYIRRLIELGRQRGEPWSMEDRRRSFDPVPFSFRGRLKPFQADAVHVMLGKEFGTLSAPTGAGKTVMALNMISRRAQPALIIVHTKELARQWVEGIETFLGIAEKEIGRIGAGHRRVGEKITVGLIQSLYSCADEVARHVGHLVVDECHRIPTRTFTEAVGEFDCRFMLGLSATPWRRDGLAKVIFWHVGEIQHQLEHHALIRSGDVLAADVVFRETEFTPFSDPVAEYSKMLTELVSDDDRNRLIAADVTLETRQTEGVCLVLSDRKYHCETLQALLRFGHRVEADLLTGDLSEDERKKVLERLNRGQTRVLIATGQLIGEGFDCRNLSSLFLATPIRFTGGLLQYLGRVLRPAPGKAHARVFDYVDVKVGPLKAAAKVRRRAYGTRLGSRPEDRNPPGEIDGSQR